MFPISWNFPFRKKDGTLVKMSEAMSGGGGGGSDLPPHSSSDAGKVLTVGEDGELEWDTSGAGGGDYAIGFDFTKFGNKTANNVSYSSAGATFTSDKAYITIATVIPAPFTLYVDAGDFEVQTGLSQHQRFIMGANERGLIYNYTSDKWAFYNADGWVTSDISDPAFFKNSKIKVYCDSSNIWHIYKNGVEVPFASNLVLQASQLVIGSTSLSIKTGTFTGARLYSGDYTE